MTLLSLERVELKASGRTEERTRMIGSIHTEMIKFGKTALDCTEYTNFELVTDNLMKEI